MCIRDSCSSALNDIFFEKLKKTKKLMLMLRFNGEKNFPSKPKIEFGWRFIFVVVFFLLFEIIINIFHVKKRKLYLDSYKI